MIWRPESDDFWADSSSLAPPAWFAMVVLLQFVVASGSKKMLMASLSMYLEASLVVTSISLGDKHKIVGGRIRESWR